MPISSNRLFVYAVCLVVVALMLVDLVEGKSKSKEKKEKKKEEKYEEFKCYGQSLTQNYWEMGRCDPKDKPKGCMSLRGCKMTNGQLDPDGTQKHDMRGCIEKKLLKKIKKNEDMSIEAEDLCAYFAQFNLCDGCKVCHPKKGDGDYCNGEGIHRLYRGASGGLVPLLAFGSVALVAMWMHFGI